ncbi:uncharacterized protein LOC107268545 [Cephus cinctus]|uniref:Uncharacterized protein LOC107268545 n=1 Tax=Cephus cinctus TaxID=211228 RepID=A0AAJ7BXN5_CEPCN|nr:uncharacterized protein LOC107268545 [Cephus cinctus]
MKCIAFVLLALAAFVIADKQPLDAEAIEPNKQEVAAPEAPRDKRGLLLSAAYTAPVAYTSYAAPLAYSAPYTYPYAYSAYSAYPYYAAAAYSAPLIVA